MKEQHKNYAIVTGASKGIGRSIAIALAKRGINLLLVARSAADLENLKIELQTSYKIAVEIFPIDLSGANAALTVFQWVLEHEFSVNILINNAGYGLWGAFAELALPEQLAMCQLNMTALVELCHLFIPLLRQHSQSYILNVSSTAAHQAVPTLAIYSATKTFVLSFTRAIRFELQNTPISVSCLCPGPVDTGFAQRAGLDPFSKMAKKFNMQPDEVAEIGIRGMMAKKPEIIPGFANAVSVFGTRILPKWLIEKLAAGIYKL